METKTSYRNIYTVSALNQQVKQLVLDHFSLIHLQGEISDFVRAASGHLYFSLKDEQSRVRCVMFRSRSVALSCAPANGLQVILSARVDFYTIRGEFQLIVQTMRLEKQGELQRRFEQLKKKLQAEALFSEERKKQLPAIPSTIGIVTSLQGAALQDILSTLQARWRLARLIIFPSAVQGEEAAAELCRMIEIADQSYDIDVLIVARGGGSLEDLAAFNDEGLARTIAACQTPVITAVGHEIDFTIADLVADCRAPTPTASANLATPEQVELKEKLSAAAKRLQQLMKYKMNQEKQGLQLRNHRLMRFHPLTRVESLMQLCDAAERRLHHSMLARLTQKRQCLQRISKQLLSNRPTIKIMHLRKELRLLNESLLRAIAYKLQQQRHCIDRLQTKYQALSPYSTLRRGYAIVSRQDGRIVDTVHKVKRDETVNVRVHDGRLSVLVKDTLIKELP